MNYPVDMRMIKVYINIQEILQECLRQIHVNIQAGPIPATYHAMKPQAQKYPPPWIHCRSVLG